MGSDLVFGFEARFALLDWGGKKGTQLFPCRSTDAAWRGQKKWRVER
jgi:hypothetical protein